LFSLQPHFKFFTVFNSVWWYWSTCNSPDSPNWMCVFTRW